MKQIRRLNVSMIVLVPVEEGKTSEQQFIESVREKICYDLILKFAFETESIIVKDSGLPAEPLTPEPPPSAQRIKAGIVITDLKEEKSK